MCKVCVNNSITKFLVQYELDFCAKKCLATSEATEEPEHVPIEPKLNLGKFGSQKVNAA